MTREDSINLLKQVNHILVNDDDYWTENTHEPLNTAFSMAIKALEQESLLDKVRDEIMDTGAYEQEVNGNTEFLKGINYCLGVIDKYKAKTEGAE